LLEEYNVSFNAKPFGKLSASIKALAAAQSATFVCMYSIAQRLNPITRFF
tara:strand:- start:1566 stop:1715 length:150 start_codon:yes stop_codon:yes gene_type:complete